MDLYREFPEVKFDEGPPGAFDADGTAYKTYSIGGLIEEGALFPSLLNATEKQVWQAFLDRFRDALGNNRRVVVRKWPYMATSTVMVLDTFESDQPRLVPITKMRVTGRFTFYPE